MSKTNIGKIARILTSRGQTIYGRQRIVDICSTAGVDPMEETGGKEDIGRYQTFLIEYSKLGPAARVTLMILGKQYEVEIPEEALKKRGKFG
ncbi:MAG: hypothetical protein ACTSUB_10335 [Candidatus Thorarchaeota archaeon]